MTKNQRLYGLFLSLNHILTLFFWSAFDFKFGLIAKLSLPPWNFWPFIPSSLSFAVSQMAAPVVASYISLSLLTVMAFAWPRSPEKLLWPLFSLTFLLKLLIYFSSYDFMGNYHYMANIMMAAFILTRAHLKSLQIVLVLFYFGAGLIKLNWEWISGAALLRESILQGPLLIAACCYVVLLEVVLIWGLFSKNPKLQKLTLAQLVCFHLFSWHIVGFYYPLIMLLMLTVFFLEPQRPQLLDLRRRPGLILYCFVFLAAQAYPKLLGKNESVSAEGRMFSLNMLDAKSECLVTLSTSFKENQIYIDNPLELATRIKCDPLVHLNYARTLCTDENPQIFLNIDAKKTTDLNYTNFVKGLNVCDRSVRYSLFGNSWVQPAPLSTPAHRGEPFHNWRENPQRTGYLPEKINLTGSTLSSDLPVNLNIHSAAKSTPLVTGGHSPGPNWVVGTDSGYLMAFQNQELVWQSYFPSTHFGFHSSPAGNSQSFIIGSYDGILHHIDSSGKRLWGIYLGSFIGASPLVVDDHVYISVENANGHSRLFKLDLRGHIHWVSDSYPGLAHASPSLSLNGEMIFNASNKGIAIALESHTGKARWRRDLNESIIATPVVTKSEVVFFSTDGTVWALDPATGSHIWTLKLSSGGGRSTPSYSPSQDILIVSSESGMHHGIQSGKIVWQTASARGVVASGIIAPSVSEELFWSACETYTLCALSVATGEKRRSIQLRNSFSSSPVYKDGQLLIIHDGRDNLEAGYTLIK